MYHGDAHTPDDDACRGADRYPDADLYSGDIASVLVTEEQIRCRIAELAQQVAADFPAEQDKGELLLVGVLKGAVMFMTDFARALPIPVQLEFMAVSSYGSATSSSGVVRILKGLDRDIADRNVLVVEDIIDSGLTLNYLLKNLRTRRPASLEVVALLQKTSVQEVALDIKYEGFTIPPEFVIGYGLDYDERFRNLPYIATLKPEAYSGVPG
jgi:hypoxanthine phosphoribosyltransferase